MRGYLQRLVESGTPASASAPTVTPVGTSTSPIAESDQRLSIDELGTLLDRARLGSDEPAPLRDASSDIAGESVSVHAELPERAAARLRAAEHTAPDTRADAARGNDREIEAEPRAAPPKRSAAVVEGHHTPQPPTPAHVTHELERASAAQAETSAHSEIAASPARDQGAEQMRRAAPEAPRVRPVAQPEPAAATPEHAPPEPRQARATRPLTRSEPLDIELAPRSEAREHLPPMRPSVAEPGDDEPPLPPARHVADELESDGFGGEPARTPEPPSRTVVVREELRVREPVPTDKPRETAPKLPCTAAAASVIGPLPSMARRGPRLDLWLR